MILLVHYHSSGSPLPRLGGNRFTRAFHGRARAIAVELADRVEIIRNGIFSILLGMSV